MKFVLFTVCLALGVLAEDTYETAFDDNFNVSEVLQNERLLKSYANCLLDKGPCTPEVKQLKDKLPEALATKCAKCTEKQKQNGKHLGKEVKTRYPEIWSELVAHYDADGKYQESWKEFLE